MFVFFITYITGLKWLENLLLRPVTEGPRLPSTPLRGSGPYKVVFSPFSSTHQKIIFVSVWIWVTEYLPENLMTSRDLVRISQAGLYFTDRHFTNLSVK